MFKFSNNNEGIKSRSHVLKVRSIWNRNEHSVQICYDKSVNVVNFSSDGDGLPHSTVSLKEFTAGMIFLGYF